MNFSYRIENKYEIVEEKIGTTLNLTCKKISYVHENCYDDVSISWKIDDLRNLSKPRQEFYPKSYSLKLIKSFLRTKKWLIENRPELLI